MSSASNTIKTNGIAWGRVALVLTAAVGIGTGIGYVTRGAADSPKQAERVRATPAVAQQIVPTYEKRAAPAALTPNLPLENQKDEQTAGAAKPRGSGKPKQASYEQKLWEAHLAAGVGGEDFPQDDAMQATTAASSGPGRHGAGGCSLPPTVPVVMQIESAGYTERGGMLNAVITQPAMGIGMSCTVLPTGTRVSMEFWGEPGEASMIEIGFPTFVVPGKGAIQPQPMAGAAENASNAQLPDHLSGWVTTPTLSLDSGDTVSLHLRGVLNATH